MATKQFQNAKLNVTHLDLKDDASRSVLQSGENISHSLGKIARWYKDIIWTDSKATTEVFGIVKLSDDYKSESTETVPTSKTLNDVVKLIKQTGGWNTTYDFNSNIEGDENLQNGQFKVTEHDLEGDIDHYVSIKGLGSAAFTESSAYATAGHTHKYAGSASVGGPATSANKLNTDAGSTANPVYFKNGIPVACTHSLNSTVPSDAVFTDTTYIIESGDSNGQIKITPSVGDSYNVSVKGLGSAAYTNKSNYATADHTHKYAGSDFVGGAATSANKLNTDAGSDVTPIYFSNGIPVACTYSLNKTVPSNAVFTDAKVKQTATTTDADYEILFSSTADNTTRTEGARKSNKLTFNPSTGVLTTTKFVGELSGNATSAITANKLSNTTAIGSSFKPVYFSADGIPVAIDHSIETSVPSNAVFTDTTYTVSSGDNNGQIKVTPSEGDPYNVSIKGLGSAAYTDSDEYATAGHTHKYAGSSSAGGVANSAAKLSDIPTAGIGSETKPVFFSGTTGRPIACTYSLNATVPANAIFTDEKVKQSPVTTDGSFEVLFAGSTGNTAKTEGVGKTTTLTFNPSTGALSATSFTGNGSGLTTLNASNISSGTLAVDRLPGSAVTIGTYGPAAGGTLSHSGTFDVPDFTVDAKGRITGAHTRTFTLPAQYTHPTHTSKTSGLYKITVDSLGHVSGTAAVTKSDIPALDYISSTTTRNPNVVLAGPASGTTAAAPTFRALVAADLPASGATAGSYGPSANATPGYGSTFNVPYITVDAKGRVTGIENKTVKIPASDNTDTKVTQTATTTSAAYEVLFSGTADNTTRTEGARKSNNLLFNPSTGVLQISGTEYGAIEIYRKGSAYGAAIEFYNDATNNTKTKLGSICMKDVDGDIIRYLANDSTTHKICDTKNTSFTRSLSSGTKIGTITIAGTSTDLYCQTNTNTTYSFATGDTNGTFKVTPSGGTATNIAIKGLGSAAYTASSAYATAGHTHNYAGSSSAGGVANSAAKLSTARTINGVKFDGTADIIVPRSIKHIHYANGTNGTSGYVKICTVGTNAAYGDQPIRITIGQRRISVYDIFIVFENSGSAKATIRDAYFRSNRSAKQTPEVHYHLNSNGYYDIYVKKTESQDHIFIMDYLKSDKDEGDHIELTWTNTLVSTLPSGSVKMLNEMEQYYYYNITRTANTVLAAPNGSTGKATFRTLVAADLPASGATAGSYGPSANASPAHSGTFSVPYITVDAKGRVTAISTKTITLPASGNTDTKNTAGSTNTSSKIFLIGATSQAANPQTYSHDTAYVGTDGCLYSNSTKVSVEGHTHSYLPLAGGTMTGDITFAGVSSTTYPALSNQIYFSGSTDWARILYEVTASDAGQLVFETGDDANAKIVFRNKVTSGGTYTRQVTIADGVISGNGSGLTSLNASNISSGTLSADRLATSGVTAGSYGPSTNATPGYGATFNVPYITVDAKGRVTAISTKTVKIPASDNTNTTYTFATGDNNGTFKVTPSGGTATNIAIKGLGSAAYTASSAYAAASHTHNYAGSSTAGGPATLIAMARVTQDSKVFPGQNRVKFEEYTAGDSYNLPTNAWYHIISMQGADTRYGTQIAVGMTANKKMYFRNYNNSSWQAWNEVSIAGHTHSYLSTTTKYALSSSVGGPAYSVEGSEGTDASFRHVWFSTSNTETRRAYSDKFMFEPSSGILKFNSWYPLDITDNTVDLNSYNDGNGKYGYRRYICRSTGGGNKISNKPCDSPFLLEVFLIRFATASSDYITKQVYHAFNKKTYQRFCTNGTWDSWTELKYTDTNTDTKVTQTATTTSAAYEVLFSGTADNTTRTEGARKNSNLTFNPSTGVLTATKFDGKINGKSYNEFDPTSTSTNKHCLLFYQDKMETSSGKVGADLLLDYDTIQGVLNSPGLHCGVLDALSIYISGTGDDSGIHYKGTKASYNMIKFVDNTVDTYGNGIVIGGGGLVVVGAGESADNLVSALSLTGGQEKLYLGSDSEIYFYVNCNTIGDRKGITLNTSLSFYPNSNNTGTVGTSSNKWNAMYATTFYGAFSGSGASLTSLNASNISSGTLSADRLATSGVTAGSYGPSTNASPAHSGTFNVPYITVDNKGRVMAIATRTITLPASGNTDANVKQSATSTANFRGVILGTNNTVNTGDNRETTVTGQGYITNKIFAQPSTGNLYASNIYAFANGTDEVRIALYRSGNSSWRFVNNGGTLSLQNNYYSDKVQSWYNVAQFDHSGTNAIKLMTPPQRTSTNRSTTYGYGGISMAICSKNSWAMGMSWLNNARDTIRGEFGAYGTANNLTYYYWGNEYNATKLRLYPGTGGGLVSQQSNGFRIATNGYGVIFRVDSDNFYILLTDKKTDGSELTGDNWNSKRPLQIGLSSGVCNINGSAYSANFLQNAMFFTNANNAATNRYYRVAYATTTATYSDINGLFLVTSEYGQEIGIIKVRARTESTAGVFGSTKEIRWIINSGFTENIVKLVVKNNYNNNTAATGTATAEIWLDNNTQYKGIKFTILSQGWRTNTARVWNMATSNSGSTAMPTTGVTSTINATNRDISNNAASAGKVYSTNTPGSSSHAGYSIPFFSGPIDSSSPEKNDTAASGNKSVLHNGEFRLGLLEGTTSADGYAQLVLGNGIASGTAGNKYGKISLYSSSTYAVQIIPAKLTGTRTLTLPNASGTVALTSHTHSYIPTSSAATLFSGTAAASITMTSMSGYTRLVVFCKNTSNSSYFTVELQCTTGYHYHAMTVSPPPAAQTSNSFYGLLFNLSSNTKLSVSAGKYSNLSSSASLANGPTVHITKVIGYKF